MARIDTGAGTRPGGCKVYAVDDTRGAEGVCDRAMAGERGEIGFGGRMVETLAIARHPAGDLAFADNGTVLLLIRDTRYPGRLCVR